MFALLHQFNKNSKHIPPTGDCSKRLWNSNLRNRSWSQLKQWSTSQEPANRPDAVHLILRSHLKNRTSNNGRESSAHCAKIWTPSFREWEKKLAGSTDKADHSLSYLPQLQQTTSALCFSVVVLIFQSALCPDLSHRKGCSECCFLLCAHLAPRSVMTTTTMMSCTPWRRRIKYHPEHVNLALKQHSCFWIARCSTHLAECTEKRPAHDGTKKCPKTKRQMRANERMLAKEFSTWAKLFIWTTTAHSASMERSETGGGRFMHGFD